MSKFNAYVDERFGRELVLRVYGPRGSTPEHLVVNEEFLNEELNPGDWATLTVERDSSERIPHNMPEMKCNCGEVFPGYANFDQHIRLNPSHDLEEFI